MARTERGRKARHLKLCLDAAERIRRQLVEAASARSWPDVWKAASALEWVARRVREERP